MAGLPYLELCAQNGGFSKVANSFSTAVELENQKGEDQLNTLRDRYSAFLKRLLTEQERLGKQDHASLVRQELVDVQKGVALSETTVNNFPEFTEYRKTYVDAKQKIEDQETVSVRGLYDKYSTYLTNMKVSKTRLGQIDGVQKIDEELRRILMEKPQDPEVQKIINSSVGTYYLGKVVRAPATHYVYFNQRGKEQDRRNLAPKLNGKSMILNKKHLKFDGGYADFSELGSEMSAGIAHSGAFRLIIEFAVDGLDQKGPARIFTLGNRPGTENLILGQQGERLVLYLRTSKNMDKSNSPSIDLGKVEHGKLTRLVFAYKPGDFWAWRDGKLLSTPKIEGDFSQWGLGNVILGGGPNGENAWNGTLTAFDLKNGYREKNSPESVARALGDL
jgi:hypothetical protein